MLVKNLATNGWSAMFFPASSIPAATVTFTAVTGQVTSSGVTVFAAASNGMAYKWTYTGTAWSTASVYTAATGTTLSSIGNVANLVATDANGALQQVSGSAFATVDVSAWTTYSRLATPVALRAVSGAPASNKCLSYARLAPAGTAIMTRGDNWHSSSISLYCLTGSRIDMSRHTALRFSIAALAAKATFPTLSLSTWYTSGATVSIGDYVAGSSAKQVPIPQSAITIEIPLVDLMSTTWFLTDADTIYIGGNSVGCSDRTPQRESTPACDTYFIDNIQLVDLPQYPRGPLAQIPSFPTSPLPSDTTLRAVTAVGSGALTCGDSGRCAVLTPLTLSWGVDPTPFTCTIRSLWTSVGSGQSGDPLGFPTPGSATVFAVGDAGCVYTRSGLLPGGQWQRDTSSIAASVSMFGVSGAKTVTDSTPTVFAVGSGGFVAVRSAAGVWTASSVVGTSTTLRDVSALSPTSAVAVGDAGVVVWYTSSGWTVDTTVTAVLTQAGFASTTDLLSVTSTSTAVTASGRSGLILSWTQAAGWSVVASSVNADITAISGPSLTFATASGAGLGSWHWSNKFVSSTVQPGFVDVANYGIHALSNTPTLCWEYASQWEAVLQYRFCSVFFAK